MNDPLVKFLQMNDIMEMQRSINRYESFDDWRQDVKQADIVKALSQPMGYAISPEEELIQKETRNDIIKFVWEIGKYIGVNNFKNIWFYYVAGQTASFMAQKQHVSEWVIYHRIRHALRAATQAAQIVKGKMEHDDSKYPSNSNKIAIRPVFPFESQMHVPIGEYKYNGNHLVRHTCKVPDYLKECFGDKNTRCGLCINDYGKTSCKKENQ